MPARSGDDCPARILFVFAWLVVGGEETEVRLLAQALDPASYRIEVVACCRKEACGRPGAPRSGWRRPSR